MQVEISLGLFQMGFLEEKVATVAADEVDTSVTPDEIADAVAEDGADGSDGDQQPQVQASREEISPATSSVTSPGMTRPTKAEFSRKVTSRTIQ